MFGLMGVWLRIRLSTVSSSGAGFSSGHSSHFWAGRSWGHVDDDVQEGLNCCFLSWVLFCSWSLAVCPEG